MTAPGVDLLLRVITPQLAEQPCDFCRQPLAGSRIALREAKADRVVVEVTCSNCDGVVLLEVKPEADGVARIG